MRKEEYKNGRRRSGNAPGSPQEDRRNAAAAYNGEVDDIIIKSEYGIITRSMLDRCISEYKSLLPNEEYLYTKVQTFNGLIRYLYNKLICHVLPNTFTNDYKILNDIFFKLYIPLCNIYSFTPNVLLFCNLCNISSEQVSIYNNNVIGNSNSANKNNIIHIIKSWTKEAESALVSNVSDHSSIGSMFLLKAKYQYRENDALTLQVESDAPKLDLKQISQAAKTGYIAPPEE